jgi:hypothetical protein
MEPTPHWTARWSEPEVGLVNVHSGGLVKRSVYVPGRTATAVNPLASPPPAGSSGSIRPSLSRSAQIVLPSVLQSTEVLNCPFPSRSA